MRRALSLLWPLAAESISATRHVPAPTAAGLPQRALAQLTSLLAQQTEPLGQQAVEQPAAAAAAAAAAEAPAPPSRPPWEKRKRGGKAVAATAAATAAPPSQPKPPRRRRSKAAAADAPSAAAAGALAARPPLSAAAADGGTAARSAATGALAAAVQQQQQAQQQRVQEGRVVLQDDAHPIREGDLSPAAWHVLARLRGVGHQALVVGGTVRDILLRGTPKDYDVLTSADPHQVSRRSGRSRQGVAWRQQGARLQQGGPPSPAVHRVCRAFRGQHLAGQQSGGAASASPALAFP